MEPTPVAVLLDETVRFVTTAVASGIRVLCVGEHAVSIARRLDATAIDHGALTDYRGGPFDAVVFAGSLNEAPALDLAIARAEGLLVSGGRLVIDDFDVEAPDDATLRWYFELHDILASAGLFERPASDPGRSVANRVRWQLARSYAIQHSGAAMRLAISSRFVIRELRRCEYLYRLMAYGLAPDDRGAKVIEELRGIEREGIARDELVPVGLRIVAERR